MDDGGGQFHQVLYTVVEFVSHVVYIFILFVLVRALKWAAFLACEPQTQTQTQTRMHVMHSEYWQSRLSLGTSSPFYVEFFLCKQAILGRQECCNARPNASHGRSCCLFRCCPQKYTNKICARWILCLAGCYVPSLGHLVTWIGPCRGMKSFVTGTKERIFFSQVAMASKHGLPCV